MSKLDKIVEDRKYRRKIKPFKTFERKILEAFILNRKIVVLKINFNKSDRNQANKQFIILIVSCLESFLEEIFKIMIDEKIIPIDDLLKIKKLQNIKFNLQDIDRIQKDKISLSEIIDDELNFQNFLQIKELCTLINFDKHYDDIIKNIKDGDVGFTKEESGLVKLDSMTEEEKLNWIKKQHEKTRRRLDAKGQLRMIVRTLYRFFDVDKKELFRIIQLGLETRHKIIHKAADIKIEESFAIGFMSAVIQFCAIIQEIYNIKSKSEYVKKN